MHSTAECGKCVKMLLDDVRTVDDVLEWFADNTQYSTHRLTRAYGNCNVAAMLAWLHQIRDDADMAAEMVERITKDDDM